MKNTKLFIILTFTTFLGFASFGVTAEPHFCAAHCAKHTDKDAKMCMNHCTTGKAEGHMCATHCSTQVADDPDHACAMHCANSKK